MLKDGVVSFMLLMCCRVNCMFLTWWACYITAIEFHSHADLLFPLHRTQSNTISLDWMPKRPDDHFIVIGILRTFEYLSQKKTKLCGSNYYSKVWIDMDGWMDGWMDKWIDGWTDGWMDGRMNQLNLIYDNLIWLKNWFPKEMSLIHIFTTV